MLQQPERSAPCQTRRDPFANHRPDKLRGHQNQLHVPEKMLHQAIEIGGAVVVVVLGWLFTMLARGSHDAEKQG